MQIDVTINIENDKAILVAEALGMEIINPITGTPLEDINRRVEAFLGQNLYFETHKKYADVVSEIWINEVNKNSSSASTDQQKQDVSKIIKNAVTVNLVAAIDAPQSG